MLSIGGDGVGPEVMTATRRVLDAMQLPIDWHDAEAGRDVVAREGVPITEATLAAARGADAVLFGATTTRPGEASAVLSLRRALGLYANVRPAGNVTVIRELTEDLYVQEERQLAGGRGAEAISRITSAASRRIGHFAGEYAHAAGVDAVIVAHKANILPQTQGLFLREASAAIEETGSEAVGRIVDALAHDLARFGTQGPARIIVAPNLFGDILSDITAGLSGGLGTAPSASFGHAGSMFEPVHGSAPDIAGKGIANPTAALLSAAMMLDHLSLGEAAARLRAAIREVATSGPRTRDAGGTASTDALAAAIIAALPAAVVVDPAA